MRKVVIASSILERSLDECISRFRYSLGIDSQIKYEPFSNKSGLCHNVTINEIRKRKNMSDIVIFFCIGDPNIYSHVAHSILVDMHRHILADNSEGKLSGNILKDFKALDMPKGSYYTEVHEMTIKELYRR